MRRLIKLQSLRSKRRDPTENIVPVLLLGYSPTWTFSKPLTSCLVYRYRQQRFTKDSQQRFTRGCKIGRLHSNGMTLYVLEFKLITPDSMGTY